jgi:hypothetical protein
MRFSIEAIAPCQNDIRGMILESLRAYWALAGIIHSRIGICEMMPFDASRPSLGQEFR